MSKAMVSASGSLVAATTKIDLGSAFKMSFSGGGGGGGSKWENPYDEFYNSVQKINEELRKREKLELRYQRLVNRNAATTKELASLRRE
jgi:nicotinamide mononucleotide (NMN) deamidase PncC